MSAREAVVPRPSKLGRYELISRIGQGGMAEVQLALQRGPGGFEKLVVIKLIHEHLATQRAIVDMLLDEARLAALVKHPNVVDIYDLGEEDGTYFIAMEYLEGEPVLSLLRAGRNGKRLDPLSTARLVADAAEGLDAAHELHSLAGEPIELVHHDVSLGNIVVLYNGAVKLVDFGVAKAQRAAEASGHNQGKFGYMAPEKLAGGPGDRRSDIYSLGVVLWEALTLKRLFRGGNDEDTLKLALAGRVAVPSRVNPEVPRALDSITLRALERDPALRYQTAAEMAGDLEDLLLTERYGRKNDLIAKYMQDTFKEHIAARRQLVQEVSSAGAASADVLHAAFAEPNQYGAAATGTGSGPRSRAPNTTSEFSVRFRMSSSSPDTTDEVAELRSDPVERPLTRAHRDSFAPGGSFTPTPRPTSEGEPTPSAPILAQTLGSAPGLALPPMPRGTSRVPAETPPPVEVVAPLAAVNEAQPPPRRLPAWLMLVIVMVIAIGGGGALLYFFLM